MLRMLWNDLKVGDRVRAHLEDGTIAAAVLTSVASSAGYVRDRLLQP